MKTAIYTRKSIYSDRSDSVRNQEQMCRDYIALKYPDAVCTTYTDEGFTGANTDRPELLRLLEDIRAGQIDCLIVYQLDRLSRSVKDFADIYDVLDKHSVTFLSIRENLDTSTPIGKAMMYITMVFAQMERETIAQRVTDNMVGLAKKGYWTGGRPPVGFRIEKDKKHSHLVPDRLEYVTDLFCTFIKQKYSLQGMETAYKRQGIRTMSGAFFSTAQLHKILTCPLYAPATADIYDYLRDKGCIMADSRDVWDGSTAVMVYGRTTSRDKTHRLQPPEKWIVCKGTHEPIVDADLWLAVQRQLKQNTYLKKEKYAPPLLKGILRCAKCGCLMQVSRKHYAKSMSSYYYCITRSRKGTCDISQIRCDKLDQLVLDAFKEIALDDAAILKYIRRQDDAAVDIRQLERELRTAEKKIDNLVQNLAEASQNVQKRLLNEIEHLDKEILTFQKKINFCRSQADKITDSETKAQAIRDMVKALDYVSPENLNAFARDVISECTFDGKNLFLRL